MTDADNATGGVDTRSEEAPDPRGCAGVCACIPDGVAPADGLVLVAQHSFDVGYIESGPEAWSLSLIRQEA